MAWPELKKPKEVIHGDRRDDRRYQIALDLRWRLVRRRKVLDSGTGRTIDLSSSGIWFDAGRTLPVGLNVELAIAWPALLHNVSPMQLVVLGRVVRIEGERAAIHMTQHEFRSVAGLDGRGELASVARAVPTLLAPRSFPKFETLQ